MFGRGLAIAQRDGTYFLSQAPIHAWNRSTFWRLTTGRPRSPRENFERLHQGHVQMWSRSAPITRPIFSDGFVSCRGILLSGINRETHEADTLLTHYPIGLIVRNPQERTTIAEFLRTHDHLHALELRSDSPGMKFVGLDFDYFLRDHVRGDLEVSDFESVRTVTVEWGAPVWGLIYDYAPGATCGRLTTYAHVPVHHAARLLPEHPNVRDRTAVALPTWYAVRPYAVSRDLATVAPSAPLLVSADLPGVELL